MGTIIFEGLEPFGLLIAHTASADAAGESVELTVYVLAPDQPQRHVPVRIPMPFSVARDLGTQLLEAAQAAEKNSRKQS